MVHKRKLKWKKKKRTNEQKKNNKYTVNESHNNASGGIFPHRTGDASTLSNMSSWCRRTRAPVSRVFSDRGHGPVTMEPRYNPQYGHASQCVV